MGRVWSIARQEYLTNLRRTGFIIWLAAVPVLAGLGLLVAAVFGGQVSTFLERQFAVNNVAGVVDQSGLFTPILPAYQERFKPYGDESSGREAVTSGAVSQLIVIPSDYLATGRVTVMTKDGSANSFRLDDARVFFVDHLLRDKVDPSLRQRVIDPFEPLMVSLKGGQEGQGDVGMIVNTLGAYFFGVLLIMTILTSSTYLLRSVAEEKSSRIIEIILSSVRADQLLAGKVLGLGALGLTQVMVWLASVYGLGLAAERLLGTSVPIVTRPEFLAAGLVYFLLGFLVYAVLLGSVGALGTSTQESQQLAGIFSLIAAIPLMIGGLALSNPNIFLVRVLSWFPLTAPTMMLLRLPLGEVPIVDVVASLALLVATIPIILLVGAKVFRMGLLMYGKRPSFVQVVRYLREA